VKRDRLEEVNRELENPDIWSNPEQAQGLGRERAQLENVVRTLDRLHKGLSDAGEMLELAIDEQDEETAEAVGADLQRMEQEVERLEFQRMFSGEMDPNGPASSTSRRAPAAPRRRTGPRCCCACTCAGPSGAAGETDLVEVSYGDVAGIKSATVHIDGDYAYGWCRTETGVHRLVRKSPFDSGNRRHTSFAAVFVSPEVDEDIEVEVNPADLRIDVYRASGAGGQHVNTTDSAVRITHLPSGIVVQCQNDRSQHKNKDHAMKQLRAKLYELEMMKRTAEHQKLEESKSDIGWGSQIRSYVLDQSRIKDLRTGVEVGNTQAVLDGDLDGFVEASLKQGL
jgi:peptide chain release factor 2